MYFRCLSLTTVLEVDKKVTFIPILCSKGGDEGPGDCVVFPENTVLQCCVCNRKRTGWI